MKDLNLVKLIGNLEDALIKYWTENGQVIAVMSLATNTSWKDKAGKWQKHTDWHRVSAYDEVAVWVIKNLSNGSRVYVEGHLHTDVVEGKYGLKKFYTRVIAHKIEFPKKQ